MPEETRYMTMRRDYSVQGWALLAYLGILNAAVFLVTMIASIYLTVTAFTDPSLSDVSLFTEQLLDMSGWGYMLAILIGAEVLLLWKKTTFCFDTILTKGKPMTVGSFFGILAVFMSMQLLTQLGMTAVEYVLNLFDLSMDEYAQNASISTDGLSMFLYAGLGAPISEEILFRGLVLRSMEPHGKRFAIFGSALLFGLFHGNLIQAPFAFLVGLVLGYVALEYNIGWAMVLHMLNNLIMADTIPRLLSGVPEAVSDLVFWVVMIAFGLAALVILIVKRDRIADYFRREKIDPLCWSAFFTAPGIIVLMIVLAVSFLGSFVL